MEEKKQAFQNLQGLIDAAVKKGLFENAATVIAMQNSLNLLAGLPGKQPEN